MNTKTQSTTCFLTLSALLILAELLTPCLANGQSVVIRFNTKQSNDVASLQLFARRHDMRYVKSLEEALGKGYHEFRLRKEKAGTALLSSVSSRLSNHSNVKWFEHQHKRQRYTRTSDPLFSAQWNIHGTAPGLNVDGALAQGVDGSGIVIAIVDDGVDHQHPDLKDQFRIDLSKDFNGAQGADPTPLEGDNHGTSAAGVACAKRDNDVCGIGVASGATLSGMRLISAPTSDLDEAQAMAFRRDKIDIVSCSWGPFDDAERLEAPGHLFRQAIQQGIDHGRQGKGTVFVWAGGNGRRKRDNCNYDGYANDYRTISVTAVGPGNKPTWYAEKCAMHLISAPSSDLYTAGISTVTPHGRCTSSFGGTSAAAPMIAGVVANMLQVRPELTWRDVQAVLAHSAIKVAYEYDDWSHNARGYHHSHNFGFGRLDMPSTLDVSRSWKLLPPMRECHTERLAVNTAIPEDSNGDAPLTVPIDVHVSDRCAREITFIESVTLTVQIAHRRRGQVIVHLKDPHGVISVLSEMHPDKSANYPSVGWDFSTVRHWGSVPHGRWSVIVYDGFGDYYRGTLNWIKLTIRGHASPL